MQKTSLICNNFSGINRSNSRFSSSVITALDIQNVELFSTGTNSGVGIRTTSGNVSVCDLLPEDEIVVNIFESVQKAKTYFFVHTETGTDGRIYLFSPQESTLIEKVSGLSKTGKSSATDVTQGWSDLFVFSNSEEILSIELGKTNDAGVLSEVTMMDLTDMDGRKVKGLGLVIFAGRLWVFSDQILWYSVQENIYDFSTSDSTILTSAGYIEFVKKITAIYPYLGSLAVFHNNSSCMIAQDETDQSFYKTFDSPGGCAGYDALVFHGTQLYFYDDTKKGVFSFLQVVNGDKTLGENIALDIQEELFSIPSSCVENIRALSVVTADRNEVWFLLPNLDAENSIIMIYDYIRKAWVKRKSQKINCFRTIGSKLYSAGEKIYEEYCSQEFDGKFIESFYKCTPLNLGVEYSMKIFTYPPKITLDMDYNNDFYIEYTKDYNAMTTKVRRIISRTLKNVLRFDKGVWDLNFFPVEKLNVIKKLPATYFKTLQMSFFTQEKDQNFCINNIEFGKIKVKS
ncbi:MAG: hypothetical protein E7Z92_01880 [Cyanobacteria bacterium SIG31]|nr:hypothetical protein [Cyanobacteria bacterium SIG31]